MTTPPRVTSPPASGQHWPWVVAALALWALFFATAYAPAGAPFIYATF